MTETSNGKILIVDDEDQIRMLMGRRFKNAGYEVTEGVNGKDGLEKLLAGDFDMVFSDIRMPSMDGLEFIEQARKNSIFLPFVFVSGFGDNEWALKALRFQAYDFLPKPFNSKQLVDVATSGVKYGKFLKNFYSQLKDKSIDSAPYDLAFAAHEIAKDFKED